ncbi:hypothetical protein N9D31_03795, partial [Oligoflexaceae bacterium]|nr:hypothetical protein [Oligoflexaceae bacterium]
MLKTLSLKGLLQNGVWRQNVSLEIDSDGTIAAIKNLRKDEVGSDYLIPSLCNAHSHAFQWTMAGLAESRTNPNDDFWSWRQTMYQLVEHIADEDFLNIAAFLYSTMRSHGYSSVVEFHYLHGNTASSQNLRRSEMLAQAAKKAGINITIIPIFYHFGNFGTQASKLQSPFVYSSVDAYIADVNALRSKIQSSECKVGFGVHSLRAADVGQIEKIAEHC